MIQYSCRILTAQPQAGSLPDVTERTRPDFDFLPEGARVAIVSGSFRGGYSYQENIWAEQLVRRGSTVHVFCAEPGHNGDKSSHGYTIQSVPCYGVVRRNIYVERTVGTEVQALEPHLILWFGPPQLFGRSLLDSDLDTTPMIIFMGQNRRMQAFDWRGADLSLTQRIKAIAYRLVRGSTIANACRSAALIVANTEETPDILELYLGDSDVPSKSRIRCFPLGFDPQTFSFNSDRRALARQRLGLKDTNLLLMISSRFAPEKHDAIKHLLAGALHILGRHPHVHLALVGDGDDAFSQSVRDKFESNPQSERIHTLGFCDRIALSEAFHAADAALFAQPSISCQEALGTGVYGVFADDGSMDWLLRTDEDGCFYKTGQHEGLVSALEYTVDALTEIDPEIRRIRAERASRLSYSQIIDDVLETLGQLTGEQHSED